MDFERIRDDELAASSERFIHDNYPEELRAARFSWPYDAEFNVKFVRWRTEQLKDRDDSAFYTVTEVLANEQIDLRASMPTAMIASLVLAYGTDEQRREIAPRLISGEALACLGLSEPDCGSDVASARTSAVRDGDSWIINGQKMYTTNAELSDYVFLLVRTDPAVEKHRGLTTFIVPMDLPGIEVRPVATLRGHRTNMTYYTDVRVPDGARVGAVDGGWDVMRGALQMEHRTAREFGDGGSTLRVSTRLAGILQSHGYHLSYLHDRVVEWARGTDADADGERVIDDALVRERLARVAVDVEISRLLSERNDAARDEPGVGNGSKLFASEAYARDAAVLLDIVGPTGLLAYGEADSVVGGWVEYGIRDAPVSTITAGCSEVQRDIIAERRLGLLPFRKAPRDARR